MPMIWTTKKRFMNKRIVESVNSGLIAFTGGGSGGHVYPGLSVIEELKKRNPHLDESSFVWIGSKRGIEKTILNDTSVRYFGVPAGKLRRHLSLRNLSDLFLILAGVLASLSILRRLNPRLLFSKGGYVSVPPVIAAKLLGIPVISHESDFDPGLATRINAHFSRLILLAYAESRSYFPQKKHDRIRIVGNPIRQGIVDGDPDRGRRFAGITGTKPLLLVLGGSQGAAEINRLVWELLPELIKHWVVVHQIGSGNRIDESSKEFLGHGYTFIEYIGEEFADLLAAADLVISRAGAGSIWEEAAAGKTVILVPKRDSSSRGDQVRNCEFFVSRGAALTIPKEVEPAPFLKQLIAKLLDDHTRRREIGEKARALTSGGNAARRIGEIILTTIGGSI